MTRSDDREAYADLLLDMREACERRGDVFVEQMMLLVRDWLNRNAPESDMGFEVYTPTRVMADALESGQCGIDKNGNVRLVLLDLQLVNIGDRATVLLDRETRRVGIRQPREGEQSLRVIGAGPRVRTINLASALKSIGIDLAKIAGRRPVERKDDLLIINLLNAPLMKAKRVT